MIPGAFQRRSQTLDARIAQLYVKGLSDRDTSDTCKQALGDESVSPAAVSRVSQAIAQDFDAWRTRSLAGDDVLYQSVVEVLFGRPRPLWRG